MSQRDFYIGSSAKEKLHCFFKSSALSAANGLHFFHTLLDGRFRKERSLLKLFQHTRTLIFLFEPPYRPINRLILADDNSYQKNHLLNSVAA